MILFKRPICPSMYSRLLEVGRTLRQRYHGLTVCYRVGTEGVRNNCNRDGCDSSEPVGVPWCRRVRSDTSSTEEDERKHFLVSSSLQTYKIRICYTGCFFFLFMNICKKYIILYKKKKKNYRFTVGPMVFLIIKINY